MKKQVVMLSFNKPTNIKLVCVRCKDDLSSLRQLEEPWHLDPNNYTCDCEDDEYWYLQLRDTTGE